LFIAAAESNVKGLKADRKIRKHLPLMHHPLWAALNSMKEQV
jgi:hypothetical protein